MRFALILALVLGGCAAKKPPKQPGNVEKKSDLDKDKTERDGATPDDKHDRDPKRGGDPCEGGE